MPEQKKNQKKKKTGLADSSRCGRNFCSSHGFAETHDCTHDYKTEGSQQLEECEVRREPSSGESIEDTKDSNRSPLSNGLKASCCLLSDNHASTSGDYHLCQ